MAEVENSSGSFVSIEHDGNVAVVLIDRPRANAFSVELLRELRGVFDNLAEELPGAVIISGKGPTFAAGADIAELGDPSRRAILVEEAGRTFEVVASFPRVTIAAISGAALGGGLELALACDLRIAGADARLGFPEVLLGIFPGAGGTQRLPRLIGIGHAKELILSGRSLSGDEAFTLGLVQQVTQNELVLKSAVELAARFATGAVVAQSLAKEAVDRGSSMNLADGLRLERELFLRVLETNDAQRGIDSFLANGPGRASFLGD